MTSRLISTTLILIMTVFLAACSPKNMSQVPPEQAVNLLGPAPGKALVYFMRPTGKASMNEPTLFDGQQFLGFVSAKTKIAYQAQPGKHVFRLIDGEVATLNADLAPGKIYYVMVKPASSYVTKEFTFEPQNGQIKGYDIADAYNSTYLMQPNSKGQQWYQKHQQQLAKRQPSKALTTTLKADSGYQRPVFG